MGSGGKRHGAGRQPILDDLERFFVGGECELLWRSEKATDVDRRIVQYKSTRPALIALQDYHQSLPLDKRKAHLETTYLSEDFGLKSDAEFERRELAKIPAEAPDDTPLPILSRIPTPRLMSVRPSIIEAVRQSTEEKHPNKIITARLIEGCWKEYRRGMKE